MTDDAIGAAARAVLIENYLDVKVQLERGTGTRPVLWLLARARNSAVIALRKLIEIDASETEAIRSLQAEVRLYGDMVESCRDLVARGREADREIDEQDREDLAGLIENSEDAQAVGIPQATED
jgi:thiamine pyrophosphate-dependent acetolactate synthase large subunit-like protein